MKPFSLRRRVLAALVAVFLVGVVATYAFYRLELRHELRGMEAEFHARPLDNSVTAESLLSRMRGEDVEFLGIVFVPVALLGVFIIGFVLRWSLRGLTRASEEAGRIRPGETGRHLTNDGLPVELHPLVDAVNAGLERLALAYGAERQLTADCAHQLRTPLTVMRLRLESARERPFDWPAIERDLAHLERLVTQLLDLSRKENASGRTREPLPVNLSRLLRETVADWLPLAQKQSRPVEIEAPAAQALPKDDGHRVLHLLLEQLPLKTAVKLAADITGAPRNELYDVALKLKQAKDSDEAGKLAE